MEIRKTLNGYVLIKLDKENDSIKLKNGVELYLDISFEPEKNATVTGTIWGMPSHLQYTGRPKDMPWETPMEAKIGDKCIIFYLSVINALKPSEKRYIIEGDDRYILIQYQYLYCLIRDGKIIPINGYVLIEQIEDPSITSERERLSKLNMELVITEKRNSREVTYGRVKYVGTPNRQYVDSEHTDEGVDVGVGDVVLIRRTNDIPLQYDLHQRVNEGKPLLRVQRRNLFAKL